MLIAVKAFVWRVFSAASAEFLAAVLSTVLLDGAEDEAEGMLAVLDGLLDGVDETELDGLLDGVLLATLDVAEISELDGVCETTLISDEDVSDT